MSGILIDVFSPFPGQSPQIGLTFPYDPATVALLKDLNRSYRWRVAPGQALGWLKEHSRWFAAPSVWPDVRRALLAAGYQLIEGARDGEPGRAQPQPRPAAPSLYAVLGVSPAASFEEVQAAYRARIRLVHPDANPAAQVDPEIAHRLNQAAAVLNLAFEAIRTGVSR